jgi:hypothetical protein
LPFYHHHFLADYGRYPAGQIPAKLTLEQFSSILVPLRFSQVSRQPSCRQASAAARAQLAPELANSVYIAYMQQSLQYINPLVSGGLIVPLYS